MSRSTHGGRPRVVIVGGGVASLVAGIALAQKWPDGQIELVTDTSPERAGGQLASWDERGYPVEHGLHALFGFYDEILPLLRRLGALAHFTRSPARVHAYEGGALRSFHPPTWPATFGGYPLRDRLAALRALPWFTRRAAELARAGDEALARYDALDLRALLRARGIPESIVAGNFMRALYDAPFCGARPMSAAMGLQALLRIFSRPWHYHFRLPSRRAIVAPLLRCFLAQRAGRARWRTRMLASEHGPDGRVSAIITRGPDGRRERVVADAVIVAVDCESFKRLELGALHEHPIFARARQLETVSSLSLQAWFSREPAPPGLDALVVGLPGPLSLLSPLSRARKIPPPARRLPYELIATGPEAGAEDIDDERLVHGLFAGLRELGFSIPRRWRVGVEERDVHVIVRRNRAPAERYLLCAPGVRELRPPVQGPTPNLALAGAWVRNRLALPCVNSAAESGRRAAEVIDQYLSRETAAIEFTGMPRAHPLVLPPPYEFRQVHGVVCLVRARPRSVDAALPGALVAAPGFRRRVVLAVLDYGDVRSPRDPGRLRYRYQEVVLAAVVVPRARRRGPRRPGLFPLAVYVNNDTALAVGREVYGFPKKLAEITWLSGQDRVTLSRPGRPAPGLDVRDARAIELLRVEWTAARVGVPASAPVVRLLAADVYNQLQLPDATTERHASARLAELTRVRASAVQVERTSWIPRVTVHTGRSQTDPLAAWIDERVTTSPGLELRCSFTLGAGLRVEEEAASARPAGAHEPMARIG